jgi:hypothetical protein
MSSALFLLRLCHIGRLYKTQRGHFFKKVDRHNILINSILITNVMYLL